MCWGPASSLTLRLAYCQHHTLLLQGSIQTSSTKTPLTLLFQEHPVTSLISFLKHCGKMLIKCHFYQLGDSVAFSPFMIAAVCPPPPKETSRPLAGRRLLSSARSCCLVPEASHLVWDPSLESLCVRLVSLSSLFPWCWGRTGGLTHARQAAYH